MSNPEFKGASNGQEKAPGWRRLDLVLQKGTERLRN